MTKAIYNYFIHWLSVIALALSIQAFDIKNKPKTILILGNSIVVHQPMPDSGWKGNWGMAASTIDSDFVHRLICDIRQKDSSTIIVYKNIWEFESAFASYPLSNFDSLKYPDILIMKIGENINPKKAIDSNFISHYAKLINYLDPLKKADKIIVDGFWANTTVNNKIKEYAKKNHFPFVLISDLSKDKTNTAFGIYTNKGIAAHPSDKGMRLIEQRVWKVLKPFL